jgi:hypothetical protein
MVPFLSEMVNCTGGSGQLCSASGFHRPLHLASLSESQISLSASQPSGKHVTKPNLLCVLAKSLHPTLRPRSFSHEKTKESPASLIPANVALLAAAVSGSPGLVAEHVFAPNADPTADPVSDQTQNPFDHTKPQVSVASTLGSPLVSI